MEENRIYLIVGLGNPGLLYRNTLHNVGFKIIQEWAKEREGKFKKEKALKGYVAITKEKEKKVILLMPDTYMNESGQSVRKCVDYYNISLDHLLVIVDDAAINFGEFRLKKEGSSGGHNGLKSIENQLGTQDYSRLRIGVGKKPYSKMDLSAHVLGHFTKEQKKFLPEIYERVEKGLLLWMDEGIEAAMNQLNIRKKKQNEEKTE